MADHADRSHSVWSASATERNWNCAGAIAKTKDMPEQTSYEADWGTACHQVSEKCFATGKDADAFIGTTEKGKKFEFVVDDEMAECAQRYVDYCRKQRDAYKAKTGKNAIVFVEEKFSLNSLNTPFEAGGTSDFVLYYPEWKMLEVVDLKTGRGVVVEVKGNKQARTYGLGVVLKHQSFKIDKVRVTIVQTRAAHKDGRIRSDDFTTGDLIEWTSELLEKMRASRTALDAVGSMPDAEWNATYLTAGHHCAKTFCKYAGQCPAYEQMSLNAAGVWLDDHNQPHLANIPPSTDPEKLALDLDICDLIEGWVKARRAYAHSQAEDAGLQIPGWVLVQSEGREKFKDEAEVIAKLTAADVPPEFFLNEPKLRTPKQVRAELAKKKNGMADKLALLEDASHTPITGTTLVRATKTTRAAVPSNAERFLENHTTSLFD